MVSEFERLALDARIAPTDVLARKTDDEIAGAFADAWPPALPDGFLSIAALGVSNPSLERLRLNNVDDILDPVTQRKARFQQSPSLLSTSRRRAWS